MPCRSTPGKTTTPSPRAKENHIVTLLLQPCRCQAPGKAELQHHHQAPTRAAVSLLRCRRLQRTTTLLLRRRAAAGKGEQLYCCLNSTLLPSAGGRAGATLPCRRTPGETAALSPSARENRRAVTLLLQPRSWWAQGEATELTQCSRTRGGTAAPPRSTRGAVLQSPSLLSTFRVPLFLSPVSVKRHAVCTPSLSVLPPPLSNQYGSQTLAEPPGEPPRYH